MNFTRRALACRVMPPTEPVQTIECDQHGRQQETFVCQHVVQTLRDRRPRGFFWPGESNDPRPDAWCTECNQLLKAAGWEWSEPAIEHAHIQILCGACYDEAKALNGF